MKKIIILLFFLLMFICIKDNVYAAQNLNDELCIVAPGASLSDIQIQAGCNVPIYVDANGKILNPSSESGMWDVPPESVVPPSNAVDPNKTTKTVATRTLTPVNFCADSNVLRSIRIVGMVIFIIKIIVPVVLVVMAIIKLAKVVIADEDTTDAVKNIFQKIIIGMVIFFIPTLINGILGNVNGYKDVTNDFAKCSRCLLEPNGGICKVLTK